MGHLDPEQRRILSIAFTDALICAAVVLVILFQKAQNQRLDAMLERSEATHARLKSAAENSHHYHRQINDKLTRSLGSLERIEATLKAARKPTP